MEYYLRVKSGAFQRGDGLKYKKEIILLVTALALFSLSAIFYSYNVAATSSFEISGINMYPYTGFAIVLVGFGSFFLIVASLSFSKRSKNLRDKSFKI